MKQFDAKNKRYVKLEVKNRKLSINDLYRDEFGKNWLPSYISQYDFIA